MPFTEEWFVWWIAAEMVVLQRESVCQRAPEGRILVVPNFFNLSMMEATVFLWSFDAA